MTYITSVNELNKLIRNVLIEQSGLSPVFVRSVHTEFGTDLDKKNGSIFTSLTQDDEVILFDLETNDTSNNMSETTGSQTVIYQSFRASIIMYGYVASLLAEYLVARLRTQEVRESLHEVGIHIEKVNSPTKLEEFKNGVVWARHDFDIEFACQLLVPPITTSYDYEEYTNISIETI